ncbi:MAG: penicillin-insensitive murein endopeptidase [Proteobacteria bacterium]|nr:penicillin-insensitive murein endopeptidase [Pseudomonadota bacterium]
MRLASCLVVVALVAPARAERYVVQPGETLEHVADAFGCSTAEVLRANHLNTTLVPARTVVTIPTCTRQTRLRTRRTPRTDAPAPAAITDDADDADKARAALALIDGTPVPSRAPVERGVDGPLRNGTPMPASEGYHVRRPDRAFGEPQVVAYLRAAIGEVRALYPDVHVLAVGDLSARHGGKIGDHLSHQTGVDVDLGFYFHHQPSNYPAQFVAANGDLDLEATWALLVALSRSVDLPDGASMMFLDYDLQARLVKWAIASGTPKADLEVLFQYPRGKDAMVGLIRHWPGHADHVHVRWKAK